MPGITGFIGRAQAPDSAGLEQMLGCMLHEPSYRSGTLIQPELGLGVGWAVHSGSYSDCLPVWNHRKDICLIFSGEHFGDRQAGTTDARSLVQAYESHGAKFFEQLNGAFSGVVVDLRTKELILFNDRHALGRIYLHENSDGLYFGSEAKSLLKVIPELRRLNQQSFGELLSCGCTLQGRSLFTGVSLLPGGSAWIFSPGQPIRKQSFFNPSVWEKQPPLPVEEYYGQLKHTFLRVLPRYFQGNQRVALSLTGGLDSRMVIAGDKSPPGQLPCYTFGGMFRECADVRLARQIASVTKQPHQVIPITEDFLAQFQALAERNIYCTDGAMDITGAVELFANRVAGQIAPVRLTGNYGSEVLRGNVAFKPVNLSPRVFADDFNSCLRQAGETYAREKAIPRTHFIVSKQVPWHHFARLAVEQSQLTVRSPFLDNELVRLAYQAPAALSVNRDLAYRFIGDCNADLARIPNDRGIALLPGASASNFQVFRQEFMPRVEYAFDYGMPQWLAKIDRWLIPLHPERLFLGRQKFYHFRVWYRDRLAKHIQEVLLDPRSLGRPHLSRMGVEQIVSAHVTGRGNYTTEIHKLLTSELIHRQLLERS